MGILTNIQHERLARLLVNGEAPANAYRQVFGNTDFFTAVSRCEEIVKRPDVTARMDELLAVMSLRTETSAERTLREIERLAMLDPRSIFRSDGSVRPPAEWSDDLAAAVASVKVREFPDGSVTYEVRFWDKNAALDKLGRFHKMFGTFDPRDITSMEELEMIRQEMTPERASEIYQLTLTALPAPDKK